MGRDGWWVGPGWGIIKAWRTERRSVGGYTAWLIGRRMRVVDARSVMLVGGGFARCWRRWMHTMPGCGRGGYSVRNDLSAYEDSMYVSQSCGTLSGKTVPKLRDTFASKKFARIPCSVLSDPGLNAADVRVYGGMSSLERGGKITAGVREIAKACSSPRSSVSRSVARLQECGHVERDEASRGIRRTYRLTAPIFSTKAVEQPKVKLFSCAKCKQPKKSVRGKDGICRQCVRDGKLAEIMAQHPGIAEHEAYARLKVEESPGFQQSVKTARKRIA